MTPEQCRELAEFYEARTTRIEAVAKAYDSGTVAFCLAQVAALDRESARYWREKAKGESHE